jgi:hypothetical protein
MKLTIDKFQKLHSIATMEMDELDKASNLVQILLDKPAEYVERLPLKKFAKLCDGLKDAFDLKVESESNKMPRQMIACGSKVYHLNFDIKNPFNTGRYIEVLTFSKDDPIMNMHNILASICTPMHWSWLKLRYVKDDFDVMKHEEYANDMKIADFRHGYHAMVFFYLLSQDSTINTMDYLASKMRLRKANKKRVQQLKRISQVVSDGFTTQSK